MTGDYWQGELVRLRASEPDDWETVWQWNRDAELNRGLDHIYPPQAQGTVKKQLEPSGGKPSPDAFGVMIETLNGVLVGHIGTHKCDPLAGTFSYGLAVLGEYRQRGYASEAIRLILRYMFDERRYRKAWAEVYSFNDASIRLHEKLGFQQEGRMREMVFTNGEFHDLILLGLFASDFARQRTD
jgi:RimJ/RimL family protein N-acetyltransferase